MNQAVPFVAYEHYENMAVQPGRLPGKSMPERAMKEISSRERVANFLVIMAMAFLLA